jgi:FSR family fosmidomycin resistance protein-like MFS transporter
LSVEAIRVAPDIQKGRVQLATTVVLGHAVKHIYNSALQVILLPVIKDDLALSGAQFGALSTASRLTSGVTTMWAGYLGDRFAHRSGLMLMLSLGLMGFSYLILGSAPSYWVLFAVMFLVGIGPSLYHPPAIASLSRKFPEKRGFAISLHGTGGSVGEVVGPVLTGFLLTFTFLAAFTWRDILHISVIPALGFALAIFLMMRNIPAAATGTASSRDYFTSLFALLKQRAMIVLVAVTALRSMGQSAITAFLPVYLLQDLGNTPAVVGLYMAGAQVAGIGAQPLMGYLSDRYGRKVVLVPTMVVLGLLYFALKFVAPGAPLILTILVLGGFLYSLHTIFIAAAIDVSDGQAQSTVVSLIYGASFFGTFSPFLAGIIVDVTETTSNVFIYAGIVVLVSTVVLAFQKFPQYRRSGGAAH